MRMRRLIGLMGILAVRAVWWLIAQQPPKKVEGARDLFYFGATQERHAAAHPEDSPHQQAAHGPAVTQSAASPAPRHPRRQLPPAPLPMPRARSTWASATRSNWSTRPRARSEPVDPDRDFKKGECVRMEVESNQSGYLYVLSKQSSGGWLPLFPSSGNAGRDQCGRPRRENARAQRLLLRDRRSARHGDPVRRAVAVSPRDFFELYDAIKSPAPASPGEQRQGPRGAVQMADAGVMNSAVEKMAKNFGTRDLVIKKVTPAPEQARTWTIPCMS